MLACILAIENEGDRAFMQRLYETHYAAMYRKAYAILGRRADAEDAVEACVLRLIDHLDVLRAANAISRRSYLLTAVRNQAFDQLRREKRIRRAEPEPEDAIDDRAVDARLLRAEQVETVAAALKKLSEVDRELLRRKYYEGRSDREIAEEFHLGNGAVRSRLTRARAKLRTLLQEVEAHV